MRSLLKDSASLKFNALFPLTLSERSRLLLSDQKKDAVMSELLSRVHLNTFYRSALSSKWVTAMTQTLLEKSRTNFWTNKSLAPMRKTMVIVLLSMPTKIWIAMNGKNFRLRTIILLMKSLAKYLKIILHLLLRLVYKTIFVMECRPQLQNSRKLMCMLKCYLVIILRQPNNVPYRLESSQSMS